MQRVEGRDAHHLFEETAKQPMHTLKIGILDPSSVAGGYTVDGLARIVTERAPRLPPLRWRLAEPPVRAVHPVWVDAGVPDAAAHIHAVTLPAPGGREELGEVVSAIASRHLDRSRPLWELWLVDGLGDGNVAVVFKLHHALADGLSSAQLIIDLMDGADAAPSAAGGTGPRVSPPAPVEAMPTSRQVMASVAPELARLAASFPGLLLRSRRASRIAAARRKSGEVMPAKAFTGPLTRWNRGLTPNRWYGFTDVALDDLRAVKDAFECTLNDVVLAVAAGTLRSYLADHDELPAESLSAAVPVSIRGPGEERLWGNRLSNFFPSLATDIADPVARLRAIHANAAGAKAYHDARDPQLWQDWFEYYPLVSTFQRAAVAMMHRTAKRPTYNVIVSNVRGPATPLSSGGARLEAIYSMGPIVDDLGLNITAWSYLGRMSFGVVSCRELVPDIWDLVDRIPVELGRLLEAARGASTQVAPGPAVAD